MREAAQGLLAKVGEEGVGIVGVEFWGCHRFGMYVVSILYEYTSPNHRLSRQGSKGGTTNQSVLLRELASRAGRSVGNRKRGGNEMAGRRQKHIIVMPHAEKASPPVPC